MRFFDLISFDSKGINNTTPFMSCFQHSAAQLQWDMETEQLVPGTPERTLKYHWARQEAVNAACPWNSNTNESTPTITSYMGTVDVVESIMEINEHYAAWRERTAKSLAPTMSEQTFSRIAHKPNLEPIRFWGASYGTTVGNTLAAMYPDRVSRLVLDAVMDTYDYYHGIVFSDVPDADKMVMQLFDYCFEAGPERCALAEGATSSKNIYERWLQLEKSMTDDGPVGVPRVEGFDHDIVTLSDVKLVTWWANYDPLTRWRVLVDLIAPLLDGNGTALASFKHLAQTQRLKAQVDFPECLKIDPWDVDCAEINYAWPYGFQAMKCGDLLDSERQITFESFKDDLARLIKQSNFEGYAWASLRLRSTLR